MTYLLLKGSTIQLNITVHVPSNESVTEFEYALNSNRIPMSYVSSKNSEHAISIGLNNGSLPIMYTLQPNFLKLADVQESITLPTNKGWD
jgi:hypothetical protein